MLCLWHQTRSQSRTTSRFFDFHNLGRCPRLEDECSAFGAKHAAQSRTNFPIPGAQCKSVGPILSEKRNRQDFAYDFFKKRLCF
jgi:hypothetical protein